MQTLHPFNLSFSLSLLFMGFLFANFFGIITSTKSIIFVFIVCIELTNYFVYTQKLEPSSILPDFKIVRRYRLSPKVKAQPSNTNPPSVRSTGKQSGKATSPQRDNRVSQTSFLRFFLTGRNKKKHIKFFNYPTTYAFTILNFLKIGFEFGFFVDAFKLGS